MLIKFENTNTGVGTMPGTAGQVVVGGDTIVEATVPIQVNGYVHTGDSYIEVLISVLGSTIIRLGIQFEGDLGASGAQLVEDWLNDAVEAAVLDPYHIPDLSGISIPAGYLESPTLYPITGLCTQITAS